MSMNRPAATVFAALALVCATASQAHETASKDAAPSIDVPASAEAANAVVDRFGAALKKGDMAAVEAMLDPDVLIFESGGAERNRKQYLSEHAPEDAKFLKDAHIQQTQRTARRDGNLAWVGSESETHIQKDGKTVTILGTETMVLKLEGQDWHIVHIHWSSHKKS